MSKFLSLFVLVFSFSLCAKTNNEKAFRPFTGKVLGNNVRLRCNPDLDSHVIQQYNKGDFVLVLKDKNEFWAISPPPGTKAFVYRSYILDNVVEANRVNIRLFPNLDAPVVGKLQMGQKIQGNVHSNNHKWLEIDFPKDTFFYISKEFIGYAGPKEYYTSVQKRKKSAEELLENAYTIYQEESKTSFEQITPRNVISPLEKIIKEYKDFPALVARAKELLAKFQESYLDKKLVYLEEKTNGSKNVLENDSAFKVKKSNLKNIQQTNQAVTNKNTFLFWEGVEQTFFDNWVTYNQKKSLNDFYVEQKANAAIVRGKIENYSLAIQNRPGDFILKDQKNRPMAFLYSTKVDLKNWIGKEVSLIVSPRPNNHFAYPAYYVLEIE